MATNVPPLVFTPTGIIAPLESAIEAGVQADFQAAFTVLGGPPLNFTTNTGANTNATPQSMLADAETAIIGQTNDLFLLYANLFDPALSFGRFHDALARIYYITRFSGTPTLVLVQCIGAINTQIPLGALIQDINGFQYVATQAATIPYSGSVIIPFACTTVGPIPCAANALSSADGAEIVQTISGWDAISNSAAGITGLNAESDQALEVRRYNSTAINAHGTEPSLRSNLLAVPGVIDAYVVSNRTSGVTTFMGVTLGPYSIWISVEGGSAAAIAAAILAQAPPCPMNGNTSYTIQDTQQGQQAPYPSYVMTWETPTPLPIIVAVTIANLPNIPSNAQSLISAAIVAAWSGLDLQGYNSVSQPVYGPRVSWPAIFAQRLANAINAYTCWVGIQVVAVQLGSPNDANTVTLQGTVATSGGNTTLTVTSVSSAGIAPGQWLADTLGNVPGGVQILSQLSGVAGGTGTYALTGAGKIFSIGVSQTIYSITPLSDEESINLNQFPTINAANVGLATQ